MEEIISQEPKKLSNFTGISCDSRKVKPGNAFVAIRGFKTDGNLYINEAIKNGAKIIFTDKKLNKKDITIKKVPIIQVNDAREYLAYLAAQYYNYPSELLNLIGITGTNGKTTTTHLIYHLLNYSNINDRQSSKENNITGLIGTVNVDTGKNNKPGNLTTPDPIKLQKYLLEMVNEGLKYACMEVSSHGIKLKRIVETNFAIKVGTNISADHFDLHPDFNDYMEVKKQFLEEKDDTLVLINHDDKYLRSFGRIAKKQLHFSINNVTDIFAENIKKWQRGHSFTYHLNRYLTNEKNEIIKICTIPIKTNLPGHHNIYNALIAITIALYYKIPTKIIQNFFKDFKGIWRRLEFIYDENFTIIDDCAHNPGSYEAVFNSISHMNYNNIIIVNSLRGNRGTMINKKNAETISKNLLKLNNYNFITSNCNDVVKEIDKVKPEEKDIFEKTLKENNINYEHHHLLKPALKKALDIVCDNDIILLLGPHAMDYAGEMILDIIT